MQIDGIKDMEKKMTKEVYHKKHLTTEQVIAIKEALRWMPIPKVAKQFNMPKANIFILDEPGTALDNDNMEGFVRILDLVKSYFDTTILISHIDQLKDSVDMNIEISRNDGYAFVKC